MKKSLVALTVLLFTRGALALIPEQIATCQELDPDFKQMTEILQEQLGADYHATINQQAEEAENCSELSDTVAHLLDAILFQGH